MIRAYEQLFELLGRAPAEDPQAVAEVVALEATIGRRLPAAQREWFSFAPHCRAECRPDSLGALVERTQAIDKNALRDRLYLGVHDGNVNYYVRWDEGDDPPVRLHDLTGGQLSAVEECGRFSWNVWYWTLGQRKWRYWARAFEIPFGPAAWEFMSQRYHMDRLPSEISADVVFFERDATIEVHWDMGDPTQQHTSANVILKCPTREAFVRSAGTIRPLVSWSDLARNASEAACDILAPGPSHGMR